MRERLKNLWPYLFVLAATLEVTRDWWNAWLLAGHSSYMDYFRLVVLDDAVRHGDLWPRFNEVFYFGYGSLLFHFYAPLPFYLSELFVLLGAPFTVALKLTMGLSVFFSGVFAAFLARELFGRWAAAATGALYVLAPYHLTDVLARHAFGEAVAFAWLPLILWGVLGAVQHHSAWRMIAGAAGLACLVLTHNVTAMISAPLLLGWWIFLSAGRLRTDRRGPLLGALTGVFGIMLAAFFWLPAFAETGLVQSKKSLTSGYFVYWDHFVYFKQFFSTYWAHGGSRAGVARDTMSYQLGLAHWFGLALTLPVFVLVKEWRGRLLFWWAVLLASLLMCHPFSKPLWDALPLLAFTQFPWRFLVLAALASSLAVGPAAQYLGEKLGAKNNFAIIGAACLALSPLVFYFPYTYAKHTAFVENSNKSQYKSYRNAAYREKIKLPRIHPLAEYYDLEAIRTGHEHGGPIRGTSRDDYLPVDVKQVPRQPAAHLLEAEPGEIVLVEQTRPRRYQALVQMRASGVVALSRFWYPGWQARIDGRKAETFPHSPLGLVGVKLPAGEHQVEFDFGSTPLRTVAYVVSLIGLIGLLLVAFRPAKAERR